MKVKVKKEMRAFRAVSAVWRRDVEKARESGEEWKMQKGYGVCKETTLRPLSHSLSLKDKGQTQGHWICTEGADGARHLSH